MKRGFWTCGACESENPDAAPHCLTCSMNREADELTGVTHRDHLASALVNGRLWRIAEAGPGYVIVAARFRPMAEAKAAQLLGSGAQADQTVVVAEVRRRGWLVYVRSVLTPYPSAVKPRQRAVTVRRVKRTAVVVRDPVEGRTYIGRVGAWSDDKGCWLVDCADRRIGEVRVYQSELREPEAATVRTGQHVSFMIQRTDESLIATEVRVLGSPSAA